MGFFKDHPYDDRFTIDDPARDKKAGFRIEHNRFGELAVYFPPMQYLPYAACTGVEIVPASFHVTGGCGKSVPAYAVKMNVGDGEKFVSLKMEKKANAERALEHILGKMERSAGQ